jgi:hypothetical protein
MMQKSEWAYDAPKCPNDHDPLHVTHLAHGGQHAYECNRCQMRTRKHAEESDALNEWARMVAPVEIAA